MFPVSEGSKEGIKGFKDVPAARVSWSNILDNICHISLFVQDSSFLLKLGCTAEGYFMQVRESYVIKTVFLNIKYSSKYITFFYVSPTHTAENISPRFELYYAVKKEFKCMFLFPEDDCNYWRMNTKNKLKMLK